MDNIQANNDKDKQWRMLLIYNTYRLISIMVLFSAYWFGPSYQINHILYFSVLAGFFCYGLIFLILCLKRVVKFEQQVLSSGIVDIIVVVLLINEVGNIDSALGVLLYVFVAMLSILAPGRLAIFFAAVASCTLLLVSLINYFNNPFLDIGAFFSIGVYGAGFFATAITAWYLANWVQASERLAELRSKELASMHRLNEYIVERLQYGVIYVDSQMNVKIINTAACQFLNLERSKATNLEQLSPDLYEKYIIFLTNLTGSENEYAAQTTIHDAHLQVRFYASTLSTDKSAVLIIINDLADIAQQAQQLKLASLGFFSASIAHELRNPLGAISHAGQLLAEKDDSDAEDKHLKHLILRNCERMNKIINNVLQMSRRQKAEPEIIDLYSFLTRFSREFNAVNQCNIVLNGLETINHSIQFDKTHLEQILVILCDNALVHGKDIKQNRTLISIKLLRKDSKMILKICDTGPGINDKDRKHVFDPFFSTSTFGNGMGLFLAKDLCEINQSHLKLLDTETGCCFAIYFNAMNEVTI